MVDVRGSYPKKIYPDTSIGTPRNHQLRRLFHGCITVQWVLGSYTDRPLLQYIQQTEQLYRQGKVVSFDDDRGCLCFYKDISSLVISESINFFRTLIENIN